MTLPHRIEAAEEAETADLLYEAWNTLAQDHKDFRRFACTVIEPHIGKTNAGRFAELLEVGAYLDAALTLVPEGLAVTLDTRAPAACTIAGKDGWVYAATPALALCAAAMAAQWGPLLTAQEAA